MMWISGWVSSFWQILTSMAEISSTPDDLLGFIEFITSSMYFRDAGSKWSWGSFLIIYVFTDVSGL